MDAPPDAVSTAQPHLDGVTRIAFSTDGSTIFTGGTDALVRIHNAHDPDSEPGFHDNHNEAITSLSASAEHLVTGSLDNIARYFSFPDHELEGYITRSAGVPVRWVQVDMAGERVAVCGDDLLVKIVDIRDTMNVAQLSDHPKPVRSAAWDPSGKLLVTAGCDGKLRVYDTSSTPAVCIKIMEGLVGQSEADAETSCYVAWHPSGNFFAVPLRTNEVGIVAREGWAKQKPFAQDGHYGPVSELAWSVNGKYLASASRAEVLVWSTESRQVVARHTAGATVTGLAWSPTENLLAFTTSNGTFSRWTEPVPADLPSPVLSDAAVAKKVDRLLDDDLFGDGDMDLDDKGEELDDDLGGEFMGDDWIVDDGAGYDVGDDAEDKWAKGRTEVVNVTKAQAPFVPGSTPWRNKKRYLAFNMVGVVDATDQETHNVVNVEFHDKSTRRGYHFSDDHKYTMASLGEQGIVYAAPSDGETPSLVHYRPYDSWASAADWQMPLLAGEDAVAVAAGGAADGMGTAVVATSRGFVRFLTASGVQRYVWRLGEDVVTLAAGRDMVLVVHREGGTSLDGCQNLRYTLVELESFDIVQEGKVPLPRKTTLSWAGFTADGAPAIYDSTGLLSVLDRFRRAGQARWVPLLEAVSPTGRREVYWPVGVSETHLQCIVLKGHETTPWFPRPLISDLPLRMPLLSDDAAGSLEESVARGEVLLSLAADGRREREVALDRELLQLVQGACKADQLARALDLARLMHAPSTLDAALKLAGFYHLPGLAERIAAVKAAKGQPRRKTFLPEPRGEYEASPAPRARENHKFTDFAPSSRRRTFGRASRDARDTPVADTPASAQSGHTFIPGTPGADDRDRSESPVKDTYESTDADEDAESMPPPPRVFSPKRKRPAPDADEDDDFGAGFAAPPAKAKNPFAKKPPASNPFAKPGRATLDSVKSTSFFDRVDDIEAKQPKRKPAPAKPAKATGKQATLFGMGATRKPNPAPSAADKFLTIPTDVETLDHGDTDATLEIDDDETQRSALEESTVQETVLSLGDESV